MFDSLSANHRCPRARSDVRPAHNGKVVGANPTRTTNTTVAEQTGAAFLRRINARANRAGRSSASIRPPRPLRCGRISSGREPDCESGKCGFDYRRPPPSGFFAAQLETARARPCKSVRPAQVRRAAPTPSKLSKRSAPLVRERCEERYLATAPTHCGAWRKRQRIWLLTREVLLRVEARRPDIQGVAHSGERRAWDAEAAGAEPATLTRYGNVGER